MKKLLKRNNFTGNTIEAFAIYRCRCICHAQLGSADRADLDSE